MNKHSANTLGVRLDNEIKNEFFTQTRKDNCEASGLVRGFIQEYLAIRTRGESLVFPIKLKTVEDELRKNGRISTAHAGVPAAGAGDDCTRKTKTGKRTRRAA